MNRFTNQTTIKATEEIKEAIDLPSQSPIPSHAEKMNVSSDMLDV